MDDELRELERRWRYSGQPDDMGPWLQARVRAGRLLAARLEQAAALGHAGALRALDRGPLERRPGLLDDLIQLLASWSAEAVARGLAAVAAETLELTPARVAAVRDGTGPAQDRQDVFALAAAERWIVCPCPPHAHEAREEAGRPQPSGWRRAPWVAAHYAGRGLPFPDAPDRSAVVQNHARELASSAGVLGAPRLYIALGAEVGDWLVGVRDAVAERAVWWASLPPRVMPPAPPPPAPETPPPPSGGGGRVDGIEASDSD